MDTHHTDDTEAYYVELREALDDEERAQWPDDPPHQTGIGVHAATCEEAMRLATEAAHDNGYDVFPDEHYGWDFTGEGDRMQRGLIVRRTPAHPRWRDTP